MDREPGISPGIQQDIKVFARIFAEYHETRQFAHFQFAKDKAPVGVDYLFSFVPGNFVFGDDLEFALAYQDVDDPVRSFTCRVHQRYVAKQDVFRPGDLCWKRCIPKRQNHQYSKEYNAFFTVHSDLSQRIVMTF